jgi:hypothetical protein
VTKPGEKCIVSLTERRGREVNIYALHSGCLGLKSQPGDRPYSLRLSWFSCFSRQMPGHYLKLGHDLFPSHRSEFIMQLSSFNSTSYSLSYWISVVEQTITIPTNTIGRQFTIPLAALTQAIYRWLLRNIAQGTPVGGSVMSDVYCCSNNGIYKG